MIIKTAIFKGSSTKVEQKPAFKAPEYAFIGRSNVGKSSLINMLCGQKGLAKTSSMPGKTILVNHFLINGSWYLVDLPGYGFARASKKAQASLKSMIEDYVSHSEELAMLFILLDSRHPLMEIDYNFISAVAGAGIPFAVVLTKCDKLSKAALDKNTSAMQTELDSIKPGITVFATSSEKKTGRDAILSAIEAGLNDLRNQQRNTDTI
ncbi:MAG TPA: ribosome biogenesis GTP-binding protein YihA/YsxC [Candidatus Coprenecus stercoravium]|uniref:Probable GTP-binding protein EngB n=1 Tax=Candidatus Coprenecus stercoravium TaxID=2840735 RepID=A0A9D2GRL0_9BACT|nr:ribosome biogenesis GTP-binding protein YihA/YsxC [Candidatus Coprenecus stercoravium]